MLFSWTATFCIPPARDMEQLCHLLCVTVTSHKPESVSPPKRQEFFLIFLTTLCSRHSPAISSLLARLVSHKFKPASQPQFC